MPLIGAEAAIAGRTDSIANFGVVAELRFAVAAEVAFGVEAGDEKALVAID